MQQMDFFSEYKDETPLSTTSYFLHSPNTPPSGLPNLSKLLELSINAYYTAIYAAMSELPIQEEITRFIEKVGKTTDRKAADKAVSDRGDPDVLAVQKAAYKVQHEIHRLTGLLRFNPDDNGVYVARCGPDHFILPALAEHFTLRFGDTPWTIIDEKRRVCLCRDRGGEARLVPADSVCTQCPGAENGGADDPWERLWLLYHRSVNNEGKKNLRLQRQLMPERYHKYLPEMK